MKFTGLEIEAQTVLETAKRICVAAHTAPKAKGRDNVISLILTDEDKQQLADKMIEIALREYGDEANPFTRDARNVEQAQAVVLIGVKAYQAGLKYCGMCGFADCAACREVGGRCAISVLDMGVALGSAVSLAADDRVDSRIMYTVGQAAAEMGYAEAADRVVWHGIPLSAGSKSIFFDR